MPIAPFSKSTVGDERVVDLAALDERAHGRRDRADLADEVAREVDDVGAEVAERARARACARSKRQTSVGASQPHDWR